jgi:hypothetical protein
MERLGDEEDLPQGQRIDDREPLMRNNTDVFFRQKQRPVQLKERQDHPKIQRDAKELLQLMISFLLQDWL